MDRVLAFGCHPDDVEGMCAGTLALLARKGLEIHVATMTGGEVGSPTLKPQEIRAVRLAEAEAAAKVLGGQYHYAGGHDLEVEYSGAYRRLAVRVIRQVDPLIVLTHPPADYLADHEQTSLLVRNGAYIASVPLYDCGTPGRHTSRFPYLYYWNSSSLSDIFGRPLPVHFGVDVSGVMDVKEKMLACHASQQEWLAHHNKVAIAEQMNERARRQGKIIGRQYGECFLQHRSLGHPHDNILAEILGELCVPL